jgi:hypothetical protein
MESNKTKIGSSFRGVKDNFLKNYSFIHVCIHCLGHFFPLLPSSLPPPSVPGRSCSALITNFVEEKTQA